MLWVIQDNIFNEPFFEKLLAFLDKLEIPRLMVKAVPFTGEMFPEPNVTGKAIAIGSYSFTNRALALGWTPGSWTNANYDYRVWSKAWTGYILNEPAHVCKFAEVPFQQTPFFFRPAADDKIFTGMVYDWGEYSDWKQKVLSLERDNTTIDLYYDTPVVVAEPKHIVSEYRFIVVNKQVITGSMYKDRGVGIYREVQPSETELWQFVEQMVSIWTPSDVFAIDIALHDGKYYVLEMGNFNSAGLYHCDIQKIVMALEDFCN